MSAAPAGTNPTWILVADADADCRTLISTVLARVGLETREAATGSEALAAVKADHPAVVILDVEMPDISGYEVCRELRDTFGEDLPIVFLSADRVESHDRAGGILLGADDYIVKPFNPDELLARVRRLASRSARRRPSATSYNLTRREREVLRLLAAGLQQNDIATRLAISSSTVASHLQRVLAKLNVSSRTQAVALAHREHLVRAFDAAATTA
jgi:DNA-binding NarL/FixJ family response regulator